MRKILEKISGRGILIAIILILAVTNLVTFFSARGKKNIESNQEVSQAVRQSGYKFINPLLECEIEGGLFNQRYIPFEASIKRKINDEIITKEKDVSISVYFRNLNNGPWFGINEKENFTPASLLKVPLAMALFRMNEINPGFLDKKTSFAGVNTGDFKPDYVYGDKLVFGQTYSMRELLDRMIRYSDNDAAALLAINIAEEDLNRVYTDLGINVPDVRTSDDYMSVRNYASFFRILYNSSYLDKNDSETMLGMLADSEYGQGLVAGVPNGTVVAHKFGERFVEEGGTNKKQLHDCGIVYSKNYPYLLCVMTRGNDKDKLVEAIRNVSRITFEEISKYYFK